MWQISSTVIYRRLNNSTCKTWPIIFLNFNKVLKKFTYKNFLKSKQKCALATNYLSQSSFHTFVFVCQNGQHRTLKHTDTMLHIPFLVTFICHVKWYVAKSTLFYIRILCSGMLWLRSFDRNSVVHSKKRTATNRPRNKTRKILFRTVLHEF